MARNFPSREELRSQLTAVFMPARETIGFAMGNVFHALSRHPNVYQKLREEVLEHVPPEQPLTYDLLKSLPYTQAVINESEHLSFPLFAVVPPLITFFPFPSVTVNDPN